MTLNHRITLITGKYTIPEGDSQTLTDMATYGIIVLMGKSRYSLVNTLAFSILAVVMAVYVILLPRESDFFIMRLLLLYLIFVGLALFWNINMLHTAVKAVTSDLALKYNNVERLLMDVRDGTKNFYTEKRRSVRIRTDMLAKFGDKVTGDDFVKIDEISYEGARLRTTQALKAGQIIKLNIYLPLFPRPIFVKARIVRIRPTAETKGTSVIYEAGVECTEIADGDREQLIETIDMLGSHIRKKNSR